MDNTKLANIVQQFLSKLSKSDIQSIIEFADKNKNLSQIDSSMLTPSLSAAIAGTPGVNVTPVDLNTLINPISKLQGKTLVCFGDSILGNFEAPTDIPSYIQNITGMKTYNVGFGGCRMGAHESDWDWFSMYKLVDAVVSGNFTNQETAAAGIVVPEGFVQQTAKLKAIDFTTVDYVTIAYGTNDIWSNYAGDSANPDVHDATKYMSAVRYVVKTLLTAFSHLKIMLVTPMYRTDLAPDSDSYTFCTDNKLTDFVDNLKVVGKELKVPVCDNYSEIGINKYNSTHYLSDGVHPTEAGRMLIGSKISGELLSKY